ncbi:MULTISPECIES: sugar ABC transporter ATP-binding protein [Nocardiopsis]|uniref:ABC transporter related protein n=2 Tax=Nocardiopsis TaxID=2013 RepID=D7B378_NOCDD|nr:sugar ABC transporter ATP-binding protein [Nocardiopsis dassonvillei]ADH66806.1 ABC transporter related protein [Nocardiopsis dassonvillei subsp. dassonvillei DSM 43111]APC35079.1 heme ABC transporter ATP-binding protein [Nocardiopsis dassonvillei]NKY80009.1 sugar ABC transporter ATP-binding protein [Nocardiopsis dassonvillei]VEI86473.1 Galactose/methyl galactoside import ATP-binding protein MglA [Nocardiopsis dassonvillei]
MSDTSAAPPADTDVVARVRGATKSYPGVRALDRADFEISAGEVRALLGRNGAGKSTLIRLLSGVETPDEGEIEIGGQPLGQGGIRRAAKLGVGTVYQELSLVPELSAAENLYLGTWPKAAGRIDYGRIRAGAEEVFAELGVDIAPDTRVGELPLAQQQLVEIARAFRARPRLLILDEPTSALAAGEAETVLKAVERVASRGVGVIYVSHRLDEIRRVADTVTVMRDGAVVETTPVRGATTRHIVSLMLGGETKEENRPVRRAAASGTPLLSVRDLAVPPKVDGVSFDLHPGEVLGLGGLMGSGRTEILRALAGFTPSRGTVEVDGSPVARPTPRAMKRLGVGITPEDRKGEGVVPLLGVSENMVMTWFGGASKAGTVLPSRVSGIGRGLIDRLSIKAAATDTPIVNLSGGNQQKAVIGRWLHAGSRILLLDEPTRGVDVEAKAQIYAIVRELAGQGAAVLFVSSELEELPLVCDRVLALRGGRLQGEFTGDDITLDNIMAAAMAA